MMVCFFWTVFFAVRFHLVGDEPRVTGAILLFYIATTILYTDHWLYFSGCPSFLGEWSYSVINLCVYPLYYTYLRALTRTKTSFEIPLLLLPAAVVAIVFPLNVRFHLGGEDLIHLIARLCFAAQIVWVLVRGYRLIRTTQQRLDNNYTDDRSYLLQPTHTLLLFIGFTAFVSMLLNLLGRDSFDGSILVSIPAVLMSILLYGLGYVAAHTFLPEETIAQVEAEEEEKARTATMEETDELFNKIITALREEQLFTNPNLTIQDLAAAVGSNRTYVSACINKRTNFSFSQLVAQYRVENAKAILADPQYSTDHEAVSSAIALSGFTSDQTFYRIFKELTGQTPLQYRRQNTPKM
ncbi:MAG: helix-turn-helix transcriptional regulator [Paludibacteraceae bacterium]|nr:helix-turn-helix transcriptional regulator [Paludibacteraceae bacterium]